MHVKNDVIEFSAMLSLSRNVVGRESCNFYPFDKKPPINTKKQKKSMYHKLLFTSSYAFLPVNTSLFFERSVISIKGPNYHVPLEI